MYIINFIYLGLVLLYIYMQKQLFEFLIYIYMTKIYEEVLKMPDWVVIW